MPADAAGAVLEIDLGAIVANWRLLRRLHPSGPVAGVVKADGYGLGAPRGRAGAVRGRLPAFLRGASRTRRWRSATCVPDAMLAVLNGLLPGTEADYVAHGILPVLGSLAEIDAGRRAARRPGARCRRSCTSIPACPASGSTPRELAILAADHARLRRHRAALRDDASGRPRSCRTIR